MAYEEVKEEVEKGKPVIRDRPKETPNETHGKEVHKEKYLQLPNKLKNEASLSKPLVVRKTPNVKPNVKVPVTKKLQSESRLPLDYSTKRLSMQEE